MEVVRSCLPGPTARLLPQMSVLAALTTFFLLFGSAVAQINATKCSSSFSSVYTWVRHCNASLSTCLRPLTALSSHITPSIKILVKSRHTCNPRVMGVVSVRFACMGVAVSSRAAFIISPLLSGQEYLGPTVSEGSDLCACNTVTYSLISGCGACQSATWIEYDSPRLLLPPLPTCHLAGLNGHATAQQFWPPGREFPVAARYLTHWH